MKAFVVRSPGDVSVREWETPEAGDNEVLVHPLIVGMCGTDLELIDGSIDPAYVRYPLVLGHEWVGRLASSSSTGEIHTPVVVEGIVPCGDCAACRTGASNRCEIYDEIGFTRPGALANAVTVPASLVHVLGEHVAIDDAVLIEPMAVVWRALTRIPLRTGLDVAIIGDGTVALLAAHLVGQFQPRSVTVVGRRGEQRDLAIRAGADDFITKVPSQQFDLVIEAAGNGEAVSSALSLCAKGGMVVLLGLAPHGTKVEIAPDDVVNNDIIIQGSFSYTREAFSEIVERVRRGDVHPSFLITHRFGLDESDRAVAALRGDVDTKEPRGKVVIDLEI